MNGQTPSSHRTSHTIQCVVMADRTDYVFASKAFGKIY